VTLESSTQAAAQQSGANGGASNGAEAPAEGAEEAAPPDAAPPAAPAAPVVPEGGPAEAGPVQPPPPTIPSVQLPVLAPGLASAIAPAAVLDLQSTLTLTEEYSDNFTLSSTDRESNIRSSVSPGVSLIINGARTKGLVTYNISGYYDTFNNQIGYFNSLLGQVQYQATPLLTLTAYDTLTQGDQPEQADRLGLRRDRRRFTSNVLALSADYLLSRVALRAEYVVSTFFDEGGGSSVSQTATARASTTILQANTVSLAYEYLRRSGDDVDLNGHLFAASLSRRLTERTAGGVSASYAIRDEQNVGGQAGGFSSWTTLLFGSYDLPPRLNVTGSIGYGVARSDTGEEIPKIPATLALTYRFARAIAMLSIESGFSETFNLGENFGLVGTLGVNGSLSYVFTPLLTGTASAYYRQNEPTNQGTDVRLESNEAWGGGLSLSAQLRRWLNLRLDYSYTNWSSPSRDGYTESRARASLSATF